jgi:hypothetical protein
MVNGLTEEGDLKGRKMASTRFGSNCPSMVKHPSPKSIIPSSNYLSQKCGKIIDLRIAM